MTGAFNLIHRTDSATVARQPLRSLESAPASLMRLLPIRQTESEKKVHVPITLTLVDAGGSAARPATLGTKPKIMTPDQLNADRIVGRGQSNGAFDA